MKDELNDFFIKYILTNNVRFSSGLGSPVANLRFSKDILSFGLSFHTKNIAI